MFYKEYGNTGLKVSAIGMGCMRYNMDDVNSGNLEKCAEVALYAHEKGINYFDTAPFYCADKSEIITGMALSQLKRDSYFVSSKQGVSGNQDPSYDECMQRLETTLTRLKVDYLDFYHIWGMLNAEDYNRKCDVLYKFFESAKDQGLIKNIVFSSHMDGAELEAAIATDKFKGMLIGYNALNYRFRQSGIESAYAKGMGVAVMNPLGGGLIPENPEFFNYLTEGTDLSVASAALRFVASHKEITIALNGLSNKEQVDEACKAVENLVVKPAREILKDYDTKGLSMNTLCTGCGYCNHCPFGIEIPKFMDVYNQKLLGHEEDIDNRIVNHWHLDKATLEKCVACGKCEKLCTQHLPIIKRLAEIAKA